MHCIVFAIIILLCVVLTIVMTILCPLLFIHSQFSFLFFHTPDSFLIVSLYVVKNIVCNGKTRKKIDPFVFESLLHHFTLLFFFTSFFFIFSNLTHKLRLSIYLYVWSYSLDIQKRYGSQNVLISIHIFCAPSSSYWVFVFYYILFLFKFLLLFIIILCGNFFFWLMLLWLLSGGCEIMNVIDEFFIVNKKKWYCTSVL